MLLLLLLLLSPAKCYYKLHVCESLVNATESPLKIQKGSNDKHAKCKVASKSGASTTYEYMNETGCD